MALRLPSASVRAFECGHSIHNEARQDFVEALVQVIDEAAMRAARAACDEEQPRKRGGPR